MNEFLTVGLTVRKLRLPLGVTMFGCEIDEGACWRNISFSCCSCHGENEAG